MSFLKYLGQSREERAAPRTQDGFPIRGDRIPMLKQDEYENIEVSLDAHVKVFYTDTPEHMIEYENILDRQANGMYVWLAPPKEEFLPDRACWAILVRWAELKGDLNPKLMDAIGGYAR